MTYDAPLDVGVRTGDRRFPAEGGNRRRPTPHGHSVVTPLRSKRSATVSWRPQKASQPDEHRALESFERGG